MTAADEIGLYSVETIPVETYLGLVSCWARDDDLERAQDAALRGLQARAAKIGANAVIGVRIDATQELAVSTRLRVFSVAPKVQSQSTERVLVTGTAVVVRR